MTPEADAPLVRAVREIEGHAARAGWDRPARLFALVETEQLVAASPELAEQLGVDTEAGAGELTAVEQEGLEPGEQLEALLQRIEWPDVVAGCAASVERLVLPPEADDELPEDPDAADAFARSHPLRQEVRIVAGALRAGTTYAALRMRAHDDEASVVGAPDLVPQLTELLLDTLREDTVRQGADHP